MRRLAVLSVIALVCVAGACGEQPPQWWQPPTVHSVVTSTDEVVAGTSFTVTVTVTDDREVAQVGFLFYDAARGYPLVVPCQVAPWQPAAAVTVEAVCTMPSFAPDGAWTLRVEAIDAEFSGGGEGACGCGAREVGLTVTGGSDDTTGPVVQPATISPEPVVVGAPFTVTFRASDEHPGDWDEPLWLAYYPDNANGVQCTQTAHVVLGPQEHEWSFVCPAPRVAGQPVLIADLRDAMGYPSGLWQRVDVVTP